LFCHGGVENQSGAPPKNLDGSLTSAEGVFLPHHVHVSTTLTERLDCVECHVKASDVLSVGHVFDDTPGVAEVDLGAGRSPQGVYDSSSGCASLYCHGDGQGDNGSLAVAAAPMNCASCHADSSSPSVDLGQMTGLHGFHVSIGAGCQDCHQSTTDDGLTISTPSLHINGQRDFQFSAPGFSYDQSAQSCTGTCHGYPHAARPWLGSGQAFHPSGFASPNIHSPEMELQRMDCRSCHGADLSGGAGPSCDTCHTVGWRSNCLFCHGAGDTLTGAPPRDLGTPDLSVSLSFRAHTTHVTSGVAVAFDCTECHTKPSDVLDLGHAFDNTPAKAEVDFGGLSPEGSYDGGGACSVLYCHGDGQGPNGTIADGAPPRDCGSCHAGLESGSAAWADMGGLHAFHLGSGASCQDCHQSTTSNGTSIANPALHVNAIREVDFSAAGFTWDTGQRTCSGTCHSENHSALPWLDGGQRFHPTDYALANQHSPDMELQRMDCRHCHAADLGGNLGPSCDTCHSSGWRSDCVFCHGADDNRTGAPPRDLGALPMSGSQAFVAHTVHVTPGISQAFDCLHCHLKPSDVLSMEHAFDDTPGRGEVGFAMGLSAAGVYNGAGSCSSLYCHGDGQGDNGTAVDGTAPMQCNSCHAGMTSGESAWESMSGEHRKHLQENFTCGNCHLDVTDDGLSIRGPLLHVDGANQVSFTDSRIHYNESTGRCAGNCHGDNHENERW
jgi:predicted CxxxxCH...CXXCH cytochrome family protein